MQSMDMKHKWLYLLNLDYRRMFLHGGSRNSWYQEYFLNNLDSMPKELSQSRTADSTWEQTRKGKRGEGTQGTVSDRLSLTHWGRLALPLVQMFSGWGRH